MRWQRKSHPGGWGPWHRVLADGLTLCGRRLNGFGVHSRTFAPEQGRERACSACQAQHEAGTRAPYRSSR